MSGALVYLRPRTLNEAVDALGEPGAQVLAGGTDFYPALGERWISTPVVDITAVREIKGIAREKDYFRIGGGTTWTKVLQTPLPQCFDALKSAAREIGSVQIQNRGTVAGNLCEFIVGNRKTLRAAGEILTAVIVPRTVEDAPSVFLKLGARRYLVISIVMVAAVVSVNEQGRVRYARVAVGSCSVRAQRLTALEQVLLDKPADAGLAALVSPEHLSSLSPIDDVRATAAYRCDAALTLVSVTFKRQSVFQ